MMKRGGTPRRSDALVILLEGELRRVTRQGWRPQIPLRPPKAGSMWAGAWWCSVPETPSSREKSTYVEKEPRWGYMGIH